MKMFIPLIALLVASASAAPQYAAPQQQYSAQQSRSSSVAAEPIAIVRSVYNTPTAESQAFDYSFESENGIKQNAEGQMKRIGEADVVVMRGSYEYIGADGQTYVVDWVADENGFQASAPHLPVAPEIPDPEHAALIEAQIRFAEQESRSSSNNNYASASTSNTYSVPAPAQIVEVRAPAPVNTYYVQPEQTFVRQVVSSPAQPSYVRYNY